jgi:bifunctional isochorismate lyase/aryl carrier protein
MAIPTIQPYPMPTKDELPTSKVGWRLDPTRAALLVHDMQEYFVDFYDGERAPMPELIASIDLLRRRCAARGVPVVYTAQPPVQSAADRALLEDMWGPGITRRPERAGIVPALAPTGDDTVLTKWRYSAFQRTDLLSLLRGWGRDQLIIAGVYGHIGCLMTAADAFMNDVQPFLVGDAIADFSAEMHTMALTYAAGRCAAVIATSDVAAALVPS